MSTYEEIHGKRVEVFDSDPTLDSTYEGQVWFNSTTGTLKTVLSSGAWVSSAPASNGRSSPQGFGIQTAAVMAGGATGPGNQSYVEEYNGSGWSTGGAMPAVRQDGGSAGTETAGLVWCGEGSSKLSTTIEYDGSSWTSGGTYPIAARGVRGSGTQTAGLGLGGDTPAPAASNVTAEYDGSSWTAGNSLPGGRIAAATSGPQTSALATTGKDNTPNPSVSNLNTAYDGTNWTAQTVYPLSLRQAASTGTSSSANLVAGGLGATPFSDAVTTAAQWDGSSWTTTGSLGTKSTHAGYAGTSTASVLCGGAQDYPSYPGVTQEFNQSINTITAGAFASTPNLNSTYNQRSGSGITDACLCFGGEGPPGVQSVNESFDGSSWSELNNLNTARSDLAGCGTQPASLAFGGSPGPGPIARATEEWDGSSWTTSGNLNTPTRFCQGAGIQTAAYKVGGYISPPGPTGATNTVEHYDGSSWTSQTAAPFSSYKHKALGTQTAGFVNRVNPPGFASYDYNGSSWTSGPNDIESDSQASCFGSSTSSMYGSGPPTKCTVWNDTNFSTSPNLGSGKGYSASFNAPSSASGMMYGQGNSSEKFTGETSTISAKTLTTS